MENDKIIGCDLAIPIGYDLAIPAADGSDNVTMAILSLLNAYPKLKADEEITFQMLDEVSGKAMFPNPSAAILTERVDILDHVTQNCSYSFTIVARSANQSESKKLNLKEWLDNIGRWLMGIRDLDIGAGRTFQKCTASTWGYLYGTSDNKAEDWAITMQMTYQNEFDR